VAVGTVLVVRTGDPGSGAANGTTIAGAAARIGAARAGADGRARDAGGGTGAIESAAEGDETLPVATAAATTLRSTRALRRR